DPLALMAGGAALDRAVDDVLDDYAQGRLIFNLGHGILPETPIAHVERMLRRGRAYKACSGLKAPRERKVMTTAVSLRSHAPAHSKSKRVEPDFSFTIEPDSGTDEFGLVVPGSASNDAIIGIAALEPCRTIDWRAIVAIVPNFFHPFPDVAVHVEEPKRIGPE